MPARLAAVMPHLGKRDAHISVKEVKKVHNAHSDGKVGC
jgi:hypothetical protein